MRGRLVPALAIAAALTAAPVRRAPEAATPAPAPAPSPTPASETRPAQASPPETAPSPSPAPDCPARPLDAVERDTLMRLAWRTLSGHLTGNPIRDADLEAYVFTPCLTVPRGLFVTLKKGEQVRGRQGEIEATRPLYQQVIVFTRRAATRDPRFLPLTDRDLAGMTVELSIIGARRTVSGPGDIRLDTEGVFLEKWGRRAVFLPGTALRQGWTPERTLDELCSQAALPKGCRSESARIQVFTTEDVAGGPPPEAAPTSLPGPSASPQPSPTPAVTTPPGQTPSGASRTTGARSTT